MNTKIRQIFCQIVGPFVPGFRKDRIEAKVENDILTVTLPRIQKEVKKLGRNINIG